MATAVSLGGPGAGLWMWLTGVFGIATKYAEALLSVKHRIVTPDGTMAGGSMYVIERGMNSKPLAVFFAAMTAIAAFGIGNTVQANTAVSLQAVWNFADLANALMAFPNLISLIALSPVGRNRRPQGPM